MHFTSTQQHQPDPFSQWWQLQGEWVETPNQRRGGESGVQRLREDNLVLYAKRQVGHIYRSLRHPGGSPTVLRERRALLALSNIGINVPRLVYCGVQHDAAVGWRGLLVTAELEGFTDLEHWHAGSERQNCSPAQQQRLLQTIGATLARMHLARWQHGCLYAKHLFVRMDGDTPQIALLDLEKSRRRWTSRGAARHDLRQLRRHSPWNEDEWKTLLAGYRNVYPDGLRDL